MNLQTVAQIAIVQFVRRLIKELLQITPEIIQIEAIIKLLRFSCINYCGYFEHDKETFSALQLQFFVKMPTTESKKKYSQNLFNSLSHTEGLNEELLTLELSYWKNSLRKIA